MQIPKSKLKLKLKLKLNSIGKREIENTFSQAETTQWEIIMINAIVQTQAWNEIAAVQSSLEI
jgi:hypothetical protein